MIASFTSLPTTPSHDLHMSERSTAADAPSIIIAGGGVAGLEAMMALADLAENAVRLILVAPEPDFTYRPLLVEEPFSAQPADRRALEPIATEHGASFVQAALERVDAEARELSLSDGSRVGYDALIVCVGGIERAALTDAITFTGGDQSLQVGDLLANAGQGQGQIAFVVPEGTTWPLPIYELALLTERRAREGGDEVEIRIVTPEDSPLILFGTAASESVRELLHGRGISVETSSPVRQTPDGLVVMPDHRPLDADVVVALPLIDGPRIPGLPSDERGFIPIDDRARVVGLEDVHAAGDGTNFPIKQGGLAAQQADAAAEQVAARFGASLEPEAFHPILRGKLLTGEASLDMRQDLRGGRGEGMASEDYLWWPPHKVAGRYLSAWLGQETPHDLDPPRRPLEIEVALPREWHREPMALDPYRPID